MLGLGNNLTKFLRWLSNWFAISSKQTFKVQKSEQRCPRLYSCKSTSIIYMSSDWQISFGCTIRVLKVNYFHLLCRKKSSNWNNGLILMLLLFFINKIKKLRQFSEKNLNKRALNHIVWYTNHFSHWNTNQILLFIS